MLAAHELLCPGCPNFRSMAMCAAGYDIETDGRKGDLDSICGGYMVISE